MLHIFSLDLTTYFSLGIWIILSLVISAIILGLSFLLAIQTPDSEKTSAYECGFEPFEDARNKFDVRFYVVAILFLIFDIEVAFLFPWAITASFIGISGYIAIVAFLFILILGFIYEVVRGALNPH